MLAVSSFIVLVNGQVVHLLWIDCLKVKLWSCSNDVIKSFANIYTLLFVYNFDNADGSLVSYWQQDSRKVMGSNPAPGT